MHVYSAVYVYKQYISGVLFTVNRGCRCVVESDINILIHYAQKWSDYQKECDNL